MTCQDLNGWKMTVEWALEGIRGATELAQFVRGDAEKRRDLRRKRELQLIVEALRSIYFSPRGVIALLGDICKGEQPSEEQIAMLLPDFNDNEFRVRNMLDRIDSEGQVANGLLTLRAERVLREISYGKQGVRGKVKDLLNESLTLQRPVSAEDARLLLDEINLLNDAIENAEEALVQAI